LQEIINVIHSKYRAIYKLKIIWAKSHWIIIEIVGFIEILESIKQDRLLRWD